MTSSIGWWASIDTRNYNIEVLYTVRLLTVFISLNHRDNIYKRISRLTPSNHTHTHTYSINTIRRLFFLISGDFNAWKLPNISPSLYTHYWPVYKQASINRPTHFFMTSFEEHIHWWRYFVDLSTLPITKQNSTYNKKSTHPNQSYLMLNL